MQKVGGEYQALSRDPESAGEGTRGTGGRLRGLNPSLAALITWLVCLPVAFAAATLGQADPFRLRVAMVPVVVLVGRRDRRRRRLAAAAGRSGQRDRGRAVRRVGGVHAADGAARHAVRVRRAGQRCGPAGGHGQQVRRHLAQQRRDRAVGAVELPAAVPVAGGPHVRADPRAGLAAARPGGGHRPVLRGGRRLPPMAAAAPRPASPSGDPAGAAVLLAAREGL